MSICLRKGPVLSVAYPETFSDTAIPVWEPKLGAQIKGELM